MSRYLILSVVVMFGAFASRSVAGASGLEFSYKVRHDHLAGHCDGDLVITAGGVEYRTANKKDARVWPYKEIQVFEIQSPVRVRIYTYEDRPRLMGYDKKFTFQVIGGELGQGVSNYLRTRINRPFVTSYIDDGIPLEAVVAVKHLHRFGGCQGNLKIFANHLAFEADKKEDSRSWRWSDIRGVSRLDQFRLEVLTYEPQAASPSRSYNFVLKEPFDETTYDTVWRRVYPPAKFDKQPKE